VVACTLVTTGADVNDGAAEPPVGLPNTVPDAAFESVNVSAGVVVDVATELVKSGDRLPAENAVTVPVLAPNVQVVDVQETPDPVKVNAPVTVLMEETPVPAPENVQVVMCRRRLRP
jgi:hypothetical protein